jgi:hypothetical protein
MSLAEATIPTRSGSPRLAPGPRDARPDEDVAVEPSAQRIGREHGGLAAAAAFLERREAHPEARAAQRELTAACQHEPVRPDQARLAAAEEGPL